MQNEYTELVKTFDMLALKAEQAHALSRVIQDATEKPDKDDKAIQMSIWLLSSLLEENLSSVEALQKRLLSVGTKSSFNVVTKKQEV